MTGREVTDAEVIGVIASMLLAPGGEVARDMRAMDLLVLVRAALEAWHRYEAAGPAAQALASPAPTGWFPCNVAVPTPWDAQRVIQ